MIFNPTVEPCSKCGKPAIVRADPGPHLCVNCSLERFASAMPKMGRGIYGGRFERTLEEIETAPQDRRPLPAPTPQIITQADIDETVRKLHAEKNGIAQTGQG